MKSTRASQCVENESQGMISTFTFSQAPLLILYKKTYQHRFEPGPFQLVGNCIFHCCADTRFCTKQTDKCLFYEGISREADYIFSNVTEPNLSKEMLQTSSEVKHLIRNVVATDQPKQGFWQNTFLSPITTWPGACFTEVVRLPLVAPTKCLTIYPKRGRIQPRRKMYADFIRLKQFTWQSILLAVGFEMNGLQ